MIRAGLVIAMLALFAACARGGPAVEKPRTHGVVIDVSVEEPERWAMIITNIENLRRAGIGPIEVVTYGKGLGLVLATQAPLADRMAALAQNGVTFAACENTMRKQHVERTGLLPFVTTVDSGVAELVRKQSDGWAYLKGG